MNQKRTYEYWDDEMSQRTALIRTGQAVDLVARLFESYARLAVAYYSEAGYTKQAIDALLEGDRRAIKDNLLPPIPIEVNQPLAKQKTDDQFRNDAMIDLGLLFREFKVKK